MTRVQSLKTSYLIDWNSSVASSIQEPHLIIQRGKANVRDLTLLGMLRTLPESYKSHWKDHLNKIVHAYNCTRYESTGYSPFYRMFGRHPHLPIDLICNLTPATDSLSYPQYVAKW